MRLLALLVVAALALTACTASRRGTFSAVSPSPSVSGTPDGTRSTVSWRPCQAEVEREAGAPLSGTIASCATLRVPQDWSSPNGPTFDLALIRLRSAVSGSDRIGSLLVNPGGPGVSGIELAAVAPLLLPAKILRRFDIVGFDPRGVGQSTPVECISNQAKDESTAADPDPASQADFNEQITEARQVGNGCDQKYGSELARFSTEQTARDMDAIRAAVGDEKLSYLGYSYGTLLGAVYAQLFPQRVRALVLDGAVDPRQDEVASFEGQAMGFEKAFDNFAAACRKQGSRCPIGPDARATTMRILQQTRANPVPGKGRETRRATAGHVMLAVVAALYSEQDWPDLQQALAAVRNGDPTKVFKLGDQYNGRSPNGQYDNQIDANEAVNCADDADPTAVTDIRRLQGEWRAKYPMFGAPLAMSLVGCATWPKYDDPYPTGAAKGAPPIVVVGTTGDPATPYQNTEKLAQMLGTGEVLTWQGEGHTAYPQTSCVRNAVDAYLLELRTPPQGTICPP